MINSATPQWREGTFIRLLERLWCITWLTAVIYLQICHDRVLLIRALYSKVKAFAVVKAMRIIVLSKLFAGFEELTSLVAGLVYIHGHERIICASDQALAFVQKRYWVCQDTGGQECQRQKILFPVSTWITVTARPLCCQLTLIASISSKSFSTILWLSFFDTKMKDCVDKER